MIGIELKILGQNFNLMYYPLGAMTLKFTILPLINDILCQRAMSLTPSLCKFITQLYRLQE